MEQLRLTGEAERGDVIVVIAVDRWSRDIVHGVASVRAIVARGVGWVSIREGIDATTPQGDSTLGIMAWTADQERRRIRERTVGRRRELTDAGFYVASTLPLGYAREGRRLVVAETEAAMVRDIFERCAEGESLPEIAATLPPVRRRVTWTLQAVHYVLCSRYVLGEARRSDGEWQSDAHPAIVTHDLWTRAHAAMRERVAGGRKYASGESAVRLLRGLARCASCGRRVSVRFGARHQVPDAGAKHRHYYICRGRMAQACDEGWNRARDIDEQAEALVLARLAELRHDLAREPAATPRTKVPDATAALARIEAQRRAAVDLATSGAMSSADLRAALARYDEQAARIRNETERATLQREAEERAADPARRGEVLRDVGRIAAAWSALTVAERQEAIVLLAARVEIGRAGVRMTWRTAEELAAEA